LSSIAENRISGPGFSPFCGQLNKIHPTLGNMTSISFFFLPVSKKLSENIYKDKANAPSLVNY